MKLSHQDYAHVTVLTLSGDCTSEDVEPFNRAVAERLDAGVRDFVLDCEHLEFVDSAALEAFLRLRDRAAEKSGRLRLVNPDQNIIKILEITRLDRAFQAHASLEAAVKSLR